MQLFFSAGTSDWELCLCDLWLRVCVWRSVQHIWRISFRYHLSCQRRRSTRRHSQFRFWMWACESGNICWCWRACRTRPRSSVTSLSAELHLHIPWQILLLLGQLECCCHHHQCTSVWQCEHSCWNSVHSHRQKRCAPDLLLCANGGHQCGWCWSWHQSFHFQYQSLHWCWWHHSGLWNHHLYAHSACLWSRSWGKSIFKALLIKLCNISHFVFMGAVQQLRVESLFVGLLNSCSDHHHQILRDSGCWVLVKSMSIFFQAVLTGIMILVKHILIMILSVNRSLSRTFLLTVVLWTTTFIKLLLLLLLLHLDDSGCCWVMSIYLSIYLC